MIKELALAYDLKNAPKELQDTSKAHYDAEKLVQKAIKKLETAQTELTKAQADASVTSRAFKKALDAWEPAV